MNFSTFGILTTSTSKELYRSAFERKNGERCQSQHKNGVWGTLEVFSSERELLEAWAKLCAVAQLKKKAQEAAKRAKRKAEYLETCAFLADIISKEAGSLFSKEEAFAIMAEYA